jgi:flagellar hook assembly protein FlgD
VRDASTPVEDPQLLPVRLVLGENYPNPFNPKTTVHFDLPQSGRVDLAVFDLNGRRVATLVNDQLAAGRHTASWLGQDDTGRRVASGTYVYRLQANGEVLTGKMMMVK